MGVKRCSGKRWHMFWEALALLFWLGASISAGPAAAAAPPLELAKWNKAFLLTVTNISAKLQSDNMIVNTGQCSQQGFDTLDPAIVPLDACFYKKHADGSYSYKVKKAGEWRMNSNCYCYALNVYKGGYCIPGSSDPAISLALKQGAPRSCELMRKAMLSDGAREVTAAEALAAPALQAGTAGHYVALLVRARGCNPYHCWQDDFHLARKDSNGLWSWKVGGPAENLDSRGKTVPNPQTANLPGKYDTFCGYFHVNPAKMTIGGTFDEGYRLSNQFSFFRRLPGVTVTLSETPYNQTVDGVYDGWAQQLFDEDKLWESKRGTKEWLDFYAMQNHSTSSGFAEFYSRQRGGSGPPPTLPNNYEPHEAPTEDPTDTPSEQSGEGDDPRPAPESETDYASDFMGGPRSSRGSFSSTSSSTRPGVGPAHDAANTHGSAGGTTGSSNVATAASASRAAAAATVKPRGGSGSPAATAGQVGAPGVQGKHASTAVRGSVAAPQQAGTAAEGSTANNRPRLAVPGAGKPAAVANSVPGKPAAAAPAAATMSGSAGGATSSSNVATAASAAAATARPGSSIVAGAAAGSHPAAAAATIKAGSNVAGAAAASHVAKQSIGTAANPGHSAAAADAAIKTSAAAVLNSTPAANKGAATTAPTGAVAAANSNGRAIGRKLLKGR